MPEGQRRLRQALGKVLSGKADRIRMYPALLGAYVNGQKTIKVASRPDFVWARMRGATSEVIQAINETVGLHWDLPILLYRDPNAPDVWKIYGRDVRTYSDWEGASYLPPHGDAHSLAGGPRLGADPVWVAKRQFLPLLPHPVASGTMGIFVDPDFYYWQGQYNWWPGSGTSDLSPHKPTGASDGRFVTVYISGSAGILALLPGPEFSVSEPPTDPGDYISLPNPLDGIPLAAVFLLTGSERIGWGEIYDLRFAAVAPPSTAGVTGSVRVSDEGILLGAAEYLDFIGPGVAVSLSGSYASITILGGGGGPGGGGSNATYMLAGIPAPAASVTGTVWRVPVYPYATGSLSVFLDGVSQRPGVDYVETDPLGGTYTLQFVPATGAYHATIWGILGGSQVGFYGIDDGIPVGTGTWLDAGNNLTLSLSGTVFRLDAVIPVTTGTIVVSDEGTPLGSIRQLDVRGARAVITTSGSYGTLTISPDPAELIGAMGWDDGVPIGTGTILDFVGGGVQASRSGTVIQVNVPGGAGNPPITGTIVVSDEGAVLGSARHLDVRGERASILLSGSYATLVISADPQELIGVMGQDEGVPLGTGTTLNFVGGGVVASVSGSVIQVLIAGGGGAGAIGGIFGLDDGVPQGTGVWLEAGDGLAMTISGTTLRMNGLSIIKLSDNSIQTGSFDWLNVQHGSYNAFILSGSVATISLAEGLEAYQPRDGWFHTSGLKTATGPGSTTFTNNRMNMMPIVLSRQTRVNAFGYRSVSTPTGSIVHMAIYSADPFTLGPRELMAYAVDTPGGAGGAKTAASIPNPVRLQPGFYWLGWGANLAVNIQSLGVGEFIAALGMQADYTAYQCGIFVNYTMTLTGPPASFTGTFAGYLGPGGGSAPIAYYRVQDWN